MFKNFRTSILRLRVREKLYPKFTNDEDDRVEINKAMKRFKKSNDKKSSSRIRREIGVCKRFWGCYPYQYFLNNLYRNKYDLSDDELCRYIPPFFWYNLFLPYHTPRAYSFVGENKIVMEIFFRSLEIPRPKTLAILMDGALYSADLELLTADRLPDTTAEKIFVKPVDSFGGRGISVFHRTGNGTYATKDGTDFLGYIRERGREKQSMIVQEGIVQDPEISKVYPESVNTLRIITENKGGKVRLVLAALRMGRGHSQVDNINAGGIWTPINLGSGKTAEVAMTAEQEPFPEHPDTHVPFSTYTIPRWDKITNFVHHSAGKLPFLTYIGWDIALTPEGPVVIEINRMPDVAGIEGVVGGMRDAFHIDDPGFYWKNHRP